MPSENLKIDQNHRNAIAGITDDAAQDISSLRVTSITKRLKVEQSALQPDVDVVGIGNIAGDQVNPATEAKQDDIIDNIVSKYAQKITVSGNNTYVAIAVIGTSQSSANWQAKKITVSGSDTVITWAGGGLFNQIATDLTVLVYS